MHNKSQNSSQIWIGRKLEKLEFSKIVFLISLMNHFSFFKRNKDLAPCKGISFMLLLVMFCSIEKYREREFEKKYCVCHSSQRSSYRFLNLKLFLYKDTNAEKHFIKKRFSIHNFTWQVKLQFTVLILYGKRDLFCCCVIFLPVNLDFQLLILLITPWARFSFLFEKRAIDITESTSRWKLIRSFLKHLGRYINYIKN